MRIALTLLALLIPASTQAQVRTEYRAFGVDTFNTNLNNHTDVVNTVNNAKAAKASAVFVQVRRRGDLWYMNSLAKCKAEVCKTFRSIPIAASTKISDASGVSPGF